MTKEQHDKEVSKLSKLEVQLVDLIFKTGNEELQGKFIEWQDQRNICNEGYVEFIKGLVDDLKETENLSQ